MKVADVVSDVAARISCGNTLSLRDGKWSLTSTDVSGFDNALKMHEIEKVDSVLIIGAGATARAAIAAVSAITTSVAVVSRNPEREPSITKASSINVSYLPWELTDVLNDADLVINTTPGQAADYFLSGIDKPRGTLFEVLYHPWPTAISKAWSESKAQVIDGLDLLIHQAIAQVEIFSGVACDRELLYEKMRAAALTKLA
jgi:shikimate dehydrogenase